jgi:hypothetical protein
VRFPESRQISNDILLMYLSGTTSIPNWSALFFPSAAIFPLDRVFSGWSGTLGNYYWWDCLCCPGRCWSRASGGCSCTRFIFRCRGRDRAKRRSHLICYSLVIVSFTWLPDFVEPERGHLQTRSTASRSSSGTDDDTSHLELVPLLVHQYVRN